MLFRSSTGLSKKDQATVTDNTKTIDANKKLIKTLQEEKTTRDNLYNAQMRNIDAQQAGFSAFWIKKILREELNFTGTVFSDDLSMAGAATAGGFAERAKQAQIAGCDMLLVCNNPNAASEVLNALPIIQDPLREQRLRRMMGKPKDLINYRTSIKWQQTVTQLNQLIEQHA